MKGFEMHRFKFRALLASVLLLVMVPFAASAADAFPVPDADIAQVLLDLASNYKTMGLIGILSVATLLSVQAIKAFVTEQWQYKRLIVLAVSIVYSVLAGLVIPGSNVMSVIVTVFITSGGAVALYEALKGAGLIRSV